MTIRKLLISIAEALIVYGLIIVGYGILVIHVTQTWSGDWWVDRSLPSWFTLDIFMMVSFALSFFGFIAWRYLKYTETAAKK
jgi:phosphoglycerol transferase MdoB-like AlkP superfamily enzyme